MVAISCQMQPTKEKYINKRNRQGQANKIQMQIKSNQRQKKKEKKIAENTNGTMNLIQ